MHSFIDGHLGCFHFHFLAVTNKVSMIIHVQIFIWTHTFISPGWIPSSEMTGSCVRYIVNPLRNFQTVLQSDSVILHSQQQCIRIPVSPHPPKHLVYTIWPISLILAILIDVYLIITLICISLMAIDIDLNPFKSTETYFMVQNIVCLGKYFACTCLKGMCILSLARVFCKC